MKHNVSDFVANQFARNLGSLKGLLVKAQDYAKERKFDENNFMQMRLAPDMFPFVKQVQIACDTAKGAASRLSGKEAPKFADDETTIAQLIQRVEKTKEYLGQFGEKDFENYQSQKVEFFWNPGPHLKGDDYLVSHALPNFYFHLATAYAILRSNGVPIGKGDYLGELKWQK